MTEADVDKKWLRIGFSAKRRPRTGRGRQSIGEKGVGRLSADRLGSELELKSQAQNAPAVGLRVSWDTFDAPGTDLVRVPLSLLSDPRFLVPVPTKSDKDHKSYGDAPEPIPNSSRHTGTELRINGLRQLWRPVDIDDLHRELSVLTPPFDRVTDFQLRLSNDIAPEKDGVVASPFTFAAEIEAKFSYRPGKKIRCRFTDRDSTIKPADSSADQIPWKHFVHPLTGASRSAPLAPRSDIGPVDVTLMFFPRASGTLKGTDLTLTQLRALLDANAGVKVYRDKIRVMPYGDLNKAEGGDWLGLGARKARNPAGPGRKDYRISPNQLVGAVFLSRRRNPRLVDTTGREGLVHGEPFFELKTFLMGCVFQVETHYHKVFTARRKSEPAVLRPRETVREFGIELQRLRKQLDEVRDQLPVRGTRTIERVQDQLGDTFDRIGMVQRSIEELASQATTYRTLASLGIATSTFSHETDSALDQFLASVYAACNLLRAKPPDINQALDELAKSIAAGNRISAWGHFALRRIKHDKRRRRMVNVTEIISDLVKELTPAFKASGIDLDPDLKQVDGRFFPMDIESVALNLLTNAYYFAKQANRKRRVMVSLDNAQRNAQHHLRLCVADSGPGISDTIKERIWEPLFSTKVDERGRAVGTGLGLSIVSDVVKELGGSKDVGRHNQLKGAVVTVWLPNK